MAFVPYFSHYFDDATNYIWLQKRPAVPISVMRESPNRTSSPEDLSNPMLNRSQLTSDNDSLFINNKAQKRASPVDLREAPTKLIRIEEAEAARHSASNERFSVHDDLLNKCLQASTTLEGLSTEVTEDTDLKTLIGYHDVRGSLQESNHHNAITAEHDFFRMKFNLLFSNMIERFQRFASEVEQYREINREWICLTASGLNEAPKIDGLTAKIRNKVLSTKVDSDDISKAHKRKVAKFTLPPDYDPNDSQWTLRYRNSGPGLTELLPSSGLYVNTARLDQCHILAKDCKSLARSLMMEVFSDSALKVCSLTGAKANCFDCIETGIRPGLDKGARAILIRYIEIYGREKRWSTEEPKSIVKTMRYKLYSYRLKNRNNV